MSAHPVETERRVGVLVTRHAVDQFHRRFAQDAKVAGDVIPLIYGEVQRAIRDGRIAKHVPRWCTGDGFSRQKRDHHGTTRYCWNEAQTRVYALVRGAPKGSPRRGDFDVTWRVVTVYAPGFLHWKGADV